MWERGACNFNQMLRKILVQVFGVLLSMAFRRSDSELDKMTRYSLRFFTSMEIEQRLQSKQGHYLEISMSSLHHTVCYPFIMLVSWHHSRDILLTERGGVHYLAEHT